MSTNKYYIQFFPRSNIKSALADLSRFVMHRIDDIFEVFKKYTDKSYGESPRRIMHYMTQNNQSIFGTGVPSGSSRGSTSREEQSSQESSSPVRGESSSKSLPRKQLSFDDKTKQVSEQANSDTETNVDIATAEEETEIDIKALMTRNLVKIKTMVMIREEGKILGVEIDIDLPSKPNENSQKSSEQDASALDKSPSISPSKNVQLTKGAAADSEPLLNISDSDPNVLGFFANRLFSIFSYRKLYMKQIYDCFQKFQVDVQLFYSTIGNLKWVVELLPIENEKYFSADLVKMRDDLSDKACEMLKNADPVIKEAKEEVGVWEACINSLNEYDEKYGHALSTKDEKILSSDILKKLERILQDACKEADCTVILKDGRREILLKSKTDFEWLVENFIQFLIIIEILEPKKIEEK